MSILVYKTSCKRKRYVWNPATCNCENEKLENI